MCGGLSTRPVKYLSLLVHTHFSTFPPSVQKHFFSAVVLGFQLGFRLGLGLESGIGLGSGLKFRNSVNVGSQQHDCVEQLTENVYDVLFVWLFSLLESRRTHLSSGGVHRECSTEETPESR